MLENPYQKEMRYEIDLSLYMITQMGLNKKISKHRKENLTKKQVIDKREGEKVWVFHRHTLLRSLFIHHIYTYIYIYNSVLGIMYTHAYEDKNEYCWRKTKTNIYIYIT